MDDQTDLLSGFLAKNLFTATRANLRRNIFHQDWFSVDLEYLADKFRVGFRGTALLFKNRGLKSECKVL